MFFQIAPVTNIRVEIWIDAGSSDRPKVVVDKVVGLTNKTKNIMILRTLYGIAFWS